ncbi:lipoprotein [Vibrio superstes NBRC 103154]|uniref:Lipoprotein n=2 Tax=Vibrio superstes TaxID=198815 RepID=A0A511QQG2_9VIBR|nr:lipoprotein [Vibrio superstes NBRC 103154]
MAFFMTACSSSIPYEEREEIRQSIDDESEQLIEELAEVYPEIHAQLEQAEGYATGVMSNIKVPLVGGGTGIGAVYSNVDDSTTYIDLYRYDVGAGIGLSSYRMISVLDTPENLEKFSEGFSESSWGTDWNISASGIETEQVYYLEDSEIPTYLVFESSASAVGSARLMSVSVNEELTETGVGNAKFANHESVGDESNPKWDRPLPFFAQDVVDQGFSLPLPFGISILYAETKQDMTISNLEAGFSGINNGATQPVEFISFDNNYSHSQTPQLKLDAWIFPFMNVFATVGKVNGMAHVEFESDGSLVGGLDMCQRPEALRPEICNTDGWKHALDVDLDGWNYTIGATFAAGWQDYFLAIPVSVSYVDMKNARAEELVISVSPRIGKQIPLKDTSSVDVYVGVSYLDSNLTIYGEHYGGLPDDKHINYKIEQENIDKWMGLVGASYNFNRSWAIQAEYGQNGSDKRQFVSSLTHRF